MFQYKNIGAILRNAGLVLWLFSLPIISFGQTNSFGNNPPTNSFGNKAPTNSFGNNIIKNPLDPVGSICQLIKKLVDIALMIGLPVAVIFLIYVGFKLVVAQGKPEKIAEGLRDLRYTLLGIAIFVGAWFIVFVIINTIGSFAPSIAANVCS